METNICKNCASTFEGKFCSNCGQKTAVGRLDWHYIQEEIKYTFLHINKGFLYTSKQLVTQPGRMIREFIEGKRVNHYKPILYIFVLAGLNGLLNHYVDIKKIVSSISTTESSNKLPFDPMEFTYWVSDHYAAFELILLPITALCSWLAFRKWGYNFVENIIINAYVGGLRLLINVLLFPLQYFSQGTNLFFVFTSVISLGYLVVTAWAYIQLYEKKDIAYTILRLMLFGFYFFLIYFAVIMGLVIYVVKTQH